MPKATYPDIQMLIDGEWIARPGQPVVNPATEEDIGAVPESTVEDLERAAEAAWRGFQAWRRTAPADRAAVLRRAAAILVDRADEVARSITLEEGKVFAEARAEVLRAVSILEWDAEEGRRLYGRIIPAEPGVRRLALRQPVGPVAAFAPWNFPIVTPARKVGGALAAGCSIILKPSEETPAGGFHLAQALQEAGLPPGVLNLVYGAPERTSEFLIARPEVRLMTFTGSTVVGKHLATLGGASMKRMILELGGHAPVIVCEDADPVAVARESVQGKVLNAGQVCVSPTRWFVHEAVYDRFVQAFAEEASGVTVGDGLSPDTRMGPLANPRRLAAMEEFIEDARSRGARVAAGGERLGDRGYTFPMTVVADVPGDARAMREEPFGPLALATPVRSTEEGIALANAIPYGLAGYAFTHSARNVEALTSDLEVGTLSINTFGTSAAEMPFGGVKDSGYGREGGVEGLQDYTVVKAVTHLV